MVEFNIALILMKLFWKCDMSFFLKYNSIPEEISEQEIDKIISFETIEEFTMEKRLM